MVNDYELMSAALARGRGQNFDVAAIRAAIAERDYLREEGTPKLISRELFRCEFDIVLAAQDGRHAPLNPNYRPDSRLASEQERAAREIPNSREFLTLFGGGAGTGKTHTLKEVAIGLAAAERPVVVLAPQRQQVRDLEASGLPAHTLAHALTARRLAPGAVVNLDEAGQVGGRDMLELIRLVKAHEGRLILLGDSRQHGAVAASDALRAIEKHARARVAALRTIRRQDPQLARSAEEKRFIRKDRAAVKLAADGKHVQSLDQLDRMDCIRELPDEPRRAAVAGEYLTAVERGEWPLIVAQTWNEVHAVNDAVRATLHAAGKLGEGIELTTYQATDRQRASQWRVRLITLPPRSIAAAHIGPAGFLLADNFSDPRIDRNGEGKKVGLRYALPAHRVLARGENHSRLREHPHSSCELSVAGLEKIQTGAMRDDFDVGPRLAKRFADVLHVVE